MEKVKSYDSFDDFARDQSPKNIQIIVALRKLVEAAVPTLRETVKWGNGCWANEKLPVAFAHCEEDHVQFGFFGGSLLSDPTRVLEGNGKYVRHVKIYSPEDIDKDALVPLIEQAAKMDY
jgi:hypothetical protein